MMGAATQGRGLLSTVQHIGLARHEAIHALVSWSKAAQALLRQAAPGARLKSAPGFSLGRTEAGNMRKCSRSDHWAGRPGARLQADRSRDVPHAQAAVQRGREQPARIRGQRQVSDAVGVPAEAPHQARRLIIVPGR